MNKIKLIIKTAFARFFMRKSIDKTAWVFSSTDNEKYNYNSKYLFEYVKDQYRGQIKPYYVINDDKERERLKKIYGKQFFIETKTLKGIQHVLECGVWFTSAGMPVYGINLKRNRIIVNLWHGIPLKKIALMDPNLNKITKAFFKKFFSENYSYILTTSSKLKKIMMKSFAVSEKKIKVWGQPRNDGILEKKDREHILNGLYHKLPEYKKIILYAPTFRDNSETILFPFHDFNMENLNSFLEKNQLIIFIRTHINDKSSQNLEKSSRIYYMNSDIMDDVTDLLSIFDLLITDYCSIYIDYLLTLNPIIFLPYDREEYLRDRGLNFEYDDVTPGPKPDNSEDFFHEIENLLYKQDDYKSKRMELNQFLNETKHHSCEKICKYIIKKLNIKSKLDTRRRK